MPIWAYAAGGALLAGLLGGWTIRDWKADSDELAAVEAAIKQGKEQQQLADYQAGKYEEHRDAAQAAAQGRTTEIRTVYRDAGIVADLDCVPHPDALRVLDAAATSAAAQAAGQPGAEVPEAAASTGAVHGS